MSDETPDDTYPPEPAAPDAPWPPDHVPAEPLEPLPNPPDPTPEPPTPQPPQTLYDIWQGTETTPIEWTAMTGPENTDLSYEDATARAMDLEGVTDLGSVPVNYLSHHIGVKQGSQPPT